MATTTDNRKIAKEYAEELDKAAAQGYEAIDEYVHNGIPEATVFSATPDREFYGACFCFGFGGPGIWYDTDDNGVTVTWGGERGFYPVEPETADALYDYAEEMYRDCFQVW